MLTRILRITIFISTLTALMCVVALWIGASIPTTRVVGYLSNLNDEKRAFGVADMNRRLYVVQAPPFDTDWQVIFSPDGRRSLMTTENDNRVEFYMLDMTTYTLTPFPLDYNVCAPPRDTIRWSSDNRHVAFQCTPTTKSNLNGLHVWDTVMNQVTRLYEPTTFGLIAFVTYMWSPTGDTISIIDGGSVVIINTQTRQFLRPSITLEYDAMRWSPSGEKLALTAQNQMLIYDISTRTTTPIFTDVEAGIAYWSPHENWMATIAQKGSFAVVYTWDFATGQSYRIGTERYPMNNAVELRWSADEHWLLIQTDENQADRSAPIYLASRDGAEGQLVIFDGRNPRWVNDGLTLSYQVNRTERLRYGRDVVTMSIPDVFNQTDNVRLVALDVLSYTWLEEDTLLTWQSIDRYGRIRALSLPPLRGRAGWSLFPATYSVNQFALWR